MDILQNLQFLLMLLTAIAAGLSAGLYFTFSNFVMKALAQRPAAQGIAAMQAINITIINPGFMLIFFGTGIASIVLMILLFLQPLNSSHFYWLGGTLLYLIGTLGVTMFRNVPLNNQLAIAVPETEEAACLWEKYLTDWTFWNHVRTITGVIATALLILSLCYQPLSF